MRVPPSLSRNGAFTICKYDGTSMVPPRSLAIDEPLYSFIHVPRGHIRKRSGVAAIKRTQELYTTKSEDSFSIKFKSEILRRASLTMKAVGLM